MKQDFNVDHDHLGATANIFEVLGEGIGPTIGAVVQGVAALGRPWGDDVVGRAFAERYEDAAGATTYNAVEQTHQVGVFAGLLGVARASYDLVEAGNVGAADEIARLGQEEGGR